MFSLFSLSLVRSCPNESSLMRAMPFVSLIAYLFCLVICCAKPELLNVAFAYV